MYQLQGLRDTPKNPSLSLTSSKQKETIDRENNKPITFKENFIEKRVGMIYLSWDV